MTAKSLGLFLLTFFLFSLNAQEVDSVIIFGNNQATTADSTDFEQFFQGIKPADPSALFFLGDLFTGELDKELAQQNVEVIVKILKSELGFKVPFYPLVPRALKSKKNLIEFIIFFGLKASLIDAIVIYSVEKKSSLFIVLSGDDYSNKFMVVFEDILKRYLSDQIKNVFVLGQNPIFSSNSLFNHKQDSSERDNFWNLLSKYKVKAYICNSSGEYSRTFRKGVWQIDLGGKVAKGKETLIPFNQFFLLKVPTNSNNPSLTLIDNQGKQKDFIEFNKENNPIYQFKFSSLE